MPWICPNCENEIEYLDFTASTQGWGSGSAMLKKENNENRNNRIDYTDYNDSGTDETDNFEYKCPECDNNVDPSDLNWKNKETNEIIHLHLSCYKCKKDNKKCEHKRPIHCKHCRIEQEKTTKEIEPEETLHKIITPTNKILDTKNTTRKDNTENTMICKNKKCKYVFIYEINHYSNSENEFYECPKCGTINNKIDFIESIKQ